MIICVLTWCVLHMQIWDFGSAEKIKDVPEDIEYKSQVHYSCVIFVHYVRVIYRVVNCAGLLNSYTQCPKLLKLKANCSTWRTSD